VKAAYLLIDAMERGETGPQGQLPTSSEVAAKLGIGDTYLGEGTSEALVLALNEFREFLTFYPTNRRADYAQYKMGIAHFRQMRAPQRDQTETRETIKELQTAPELQAAVLEINYLPEDSPEHVASRAAETFKMLEM